MTRKGLLQKDSISKLKKMYEPIPVPPYLDWSVGFDKLLAVWRYLCCNRFKSCANKCRCETRFHRLYREDNRGVKESLLTSLDLVHYIKRMRKTQLN